MVCRAIYGIYVMLLQIHFTKIRSELKSFYSCALFSKWKTDLKISKLGIVFSVALVSPGQIAVSEDENVI